MSPGYKTQVNNKHFNHSSRAEGPAVQTSAEQRNLPSEKNSDMQHPYFVITLNIKLKFLEECDFQRMLTQR